MFGLFGSKDWNVIAVIFERRDLYRVNGNRSKGNAAVKARDGAKEHARTLFWAVFDQKGAFLEGDFGPGQKMVAQPILQRLKRELPSNPTVRSILRVLEKKELEMAAKPLVWNGYPKDDVPASEEE